MSGSFGGGIFTPERPLDRTGRDLRSGVGERSITAVYSGDRNDLGGTSLVLKQVVNLLPAATITNTTTSASPSLINQPVIFTAAITSTYGPIPDGETCHVLRRWHRDGNWHEAEVNVATPLVVPGADVPAR